MSKEKPKATDDAAMATDAEAAAPKYSTTVAAANFMKQPLCQSDTVLKDSLGLPGLGAKAKEALAKVGICTPLDVFLKYCELKRDHAAFIAYLVQNGVVFVGGGAAHRTVYQVKALLCETLDAKWALISAY